MLVDVTIRGEVPDSAKLRAADEIGRLEEIVTEPVLGARVLLRQERNPRIELGARAEGEVDVNGHLVRGRVAATTMSGAVDELAEHLGRQIRRYLQARNDANREPAAGRPGEWRHGQWSPTRPDYFPRPAEEREVVRRKSFAVEPLTPLEAAAELADLDHDFFLFNDVETGADEVLYRRDDGILALIVPPAAPIPDEAAPARERSRFSEPVDLAAAVAEMNLVDHRFLFFVDGETGRGNVIYRRYDGHYGLIEPAA